jgi:ankyrin repeat protein
VNATNSLGLAAIHGAANRGWVSVIQILADHGAKLDVKDTAGRTPMTFAEGIFLAVRPPVAKPEAMALLKTLMGSEATTTSASAR